jgi:hypothetical protein
MIIAWRVLYLTMLGRECPELPCNVVFAEEEWQAVYIVAKRQPPPEKPQSTQVKACHLSMVSVP